MSTKFYCPLISRWARTLGALRAQRSDFYDNGTGAIIVQRGLQGERKGGHNSVKEASSRTFVIQHWHQLSRSCHADSFFVTAGVVTNEDTVTTWATCPTILAVFAPGAPVSRSHSRSYSPHINFLSQFKHPEWAVWQNKLWWSTRPV